jgi:hypothetical protein
MHLHFGSARALRHAVHVLGSVTHRGLVSHWTRSVTLRPFSDLKYEEDLPAAARCFIALLSYTSRLERLYVDWTPDLDSTAALGMAVCTSASSLRHLRARFDVDSLFLAMPIIARLTRLDSLSLKVVETGQTQLGAAMLEQNVSLELEPWSLNHLSSLRLLCTMQAAPLEADAFLRIEACTQIIARWLSQCQFPALREVNLSLISLSRRDDGLSSSRLATFFDHHRGLRLAHITLYGQDSYKTILPHVFSTELVLDAFALALEQSLIPHLSADVQKLVLELSSLEERHVGPTVLHMDGLARTPGEASGLRAIQFRAHDDATTPLDLRWAALSRSRKRQQKAFYKRARVHTDRLKRNGIDVFDEDGQPAPA